MIPARKRLTFALAMVAMTWILVELVVGIGLGWIPEADDFRYQPIRVDRLSREHREILERVIRGESAYRKIDPELGWTIRAGGESGLARANATGFRASREYAASPPEGVVRIATYGDSFTHGSEVGNSDTWQHQLETRHPGLEALNFGVGGYGLDQALLRYRELGPRFGAHIVLIGFLSENIYRTVNVYRPFYLPGTSSPLAKPRFRWDGEVLELLPNPLPTPDHYRALLAEPEQILPGLGKNDYFYGLRDRAAWYGALPSVRLFRYVRQRSAGDGIVRRVRTERGSADLYDAGSEAFEVTTAVFDRFVQEVSTDGSVPIVVLFPYRRDLEQIARVGVPVYAPLVQQLERRGRDVIDLAEPLLTAAAASGVDSLFERIHYSAEGNRVVAEAVAAHLRARGLIESPRRR
jgi:hypothetical protein